MKIKVNHKKVDRGFKTGNIVRQRKTGQLFLLTAKAGGTANYYASMHFDVTGGKLTPSSNQCACFDLATYELFEGSIILTNEEVKDDAD